MKIYLVVEDWCIDYESTDSPVVHIFDTLPKAQEFFDEMVQWANKEYANWTNEINSTDACNKEYLWFEYGYYNQNHFKLRLESKEVK